MFKSKGVLGMYMFVDFNSQIIAQRGSLIPQTKGVSCTNLGSLVPQTKESQGGLIHQFSV
jgi:hypothetical protein